MAMRHFFGVCSITLVIACGSGDSGGGNAGDDSGAGDGGAGDASFDVATDAAVDAEPDVSADVTPDAPADTAPDISPDVPPDTAPDATLDALPDSQPDVTPDAPADVTPDTAPDADPDALPDASTDAGRTCAGNEECARGELCDRPDGLCTAEGVCEARPESCPRVLDPVCGCDGVDYSNPCLARQAGTSVAFSGACEPVDACDDNGDCDRSQYCAAPVGTCGGGVCEMRPRECPAVEMPVCGCDDVTYSNDCVAASSGVNVAYDGMCGSGCTSNLDCLRSEWCRLDDGVCNGVGTCEVRPEICPLTVDEVCGCDGATYINPCEAYEAGVNIEYDGVCEPSPDVCRGSADCGRGEYCDFSFDGACMRTGLCATRPDGCLDVWDPVCGCDGTTYGNACEAAAAGASVLAPGECPEL